MHVSKAEIRHLETILQIINRSNNKAYKKIIPIEYFQEPVLTLDKLLEDFHEMTFYICQERTSVAGVAALRVVHDEMGQIRWVYVTPERQRMGVGTCLMEHIETEAKKMGLKKLTIPYVHEKAYWARNFYQKLRYRMVERRSRPWGDDIAYQKSLTGTDSIHP